MARVKVRKGMPSAALMKAEVSRRARERFVDPAFDPLQDEISKIIAAAWDGVMIVTSVNWYQAPLGLKGMIDRLVCAEAAAPRPAHEARCAVARDSTQVTMPK